MLTSQDVDPKDSAEKHVGATAPIASPHVCAAISLCACLHTRVQLVGEWGASVKDDRFQLKRKEVENTSSSALAAWAGVGCALCCYKNRCVAM